MPHHRLHAVTNRSIIYWSLIKMQWTMHKKRCWSREGLLCKSRQLYSWNFINRKNISIIYAKRSTAFVENHCWLSLSANWRVIVLPGLRLPSSWSLAEVRVVSFPGSVWFMRWQETSVQVRLRKDRPCDLFHCAITNSDSRCVYIYLHLNWFWMGQARKTETDL